jgi:hypothetical protein
MHAARIQSNRQRLQSSRELAAHCTIYVVNHAIKQLSTRIQVRAFAEISLPGAHNDYSAMQAIRADAN